MNFYRRLLARAERSQHDILARHEAVLRRLNRKPKPIPRRKRKPPEAGIAVPAVPPKGPLPLQGGAEAPLEFD